MKRLATTPFAELLPSSLASDPSMRAAAQALEAVQSKTLAGLPNLLLWARLFEDTDGILPPLQRLAGNRTLPPLSETELDLLAWQLHVDGYELAHTREAKRLMVLQSIPWHRRKGTPWAVRQALETALSLPAAPQEWFDYGGSPYFFRVRLDVSGMAFGLARAAHAFTLIFEYKNVRSWLEELITCSTTPLEECVAVGLRGRTVSQSPLVFAASELPVMRPRVALGLRGHTTSASQLRFRTLTPPAAQGCFAACLGGITTTRVAWKATGATGTHHG